MSEQNLHDLLYKPYAEIISLFKGLEPPSLEEMDGEYVATGLDQGSRFWNAFSAMSVHLRGLWIGKAFNPVSETRGRGYNFFNTPRGIRRILPMGTYIGQSTIKDMEGPSYFVDYSLYHRGMLGSGHDELRKLSDNLYLGFGVLPFFGGRKEKLFPFALAGPARNFDVSAFDSFSEIEPNSRSRDGR